MPFLFLLTLPDHRDISSRLLRPKQCLAYTYLLSGSRHAHVAGAAKLAPYPNQQVEYRRRSWVNAQYYEWRSFVNEAQAIQKDVGLG
jgi:hypothetical protein